jgi:hypothetical protein
MTNNAPAANAAPPAPQTTREFAAKRRIQPGSVLKRYGQTGSYFGIVPVKGPNGRLLWPADGGQ